MICGQPVSAPTHSKHVVEAISAAKTARVRTRMRSSVAPMTSAAAGKIGRMYDGSLDPEMLKNTRTNADQIRQKRCHAKACVPDSERQFCRRPNSMTPV